MTQTDILWVKSGTENLNHITSKLFIELQINFIILVDLFTSYFLKIKPFTGKR